MVQFQFAWIYSWFQIISIIIIYLYLFILFNVASGHFTQLVWKKSTQLGCALAMTTNNRVLAVCRYTPPGNYLGLFASNVAPLNGFGRKFIEMCINETMQSVQHNEMINN